MEFEDQLAVIKITGFNNKEPLPLYYLTLLQILKVTVYPTMDSLPINTELDLPYHVRYVYKELINNHTGDNLPSFINPVTLRTSGTDFMVFENFNNSITYSLICAKKEFLDIIHQTNNFDHFDANFIESMATPSKNLIIEVFKSLNRHDYNFIKNLIRDMLYNSHNDLSGPILYNMIMYIFPFVCAQALNSTDIINIWSHSYIAEVLMDLSHQVPFYMIISSKASTMDYVILHYPYLKVYFDFSFNFLNFWTSGYQRTLELFGPNYNLGTHLLTINQYLITTSTTSLVILGTGYAGYRIYLYYAVGINAAVITSLATISENQPFWS